MMGQQDGNRIKRFNVGLNGIESVSKGYPM